MIQPAVVGSDEHVFFLNFKFGYSQEFPAAFFLDGISNTESSGLSVCHGEASLFEAGRMNRQNRRSRYRM